MHGVEFPESTNELQPANELQPVADEVPPRELSRT
jgi:hypothetical protein